jgi:flagellar biosynthesis protein FlhG
MTLYKVLGVDRSASDDEIRRAYKLQRRSSAKTASPSRRSWISRPLQREQARISEAYDTLLEPSRRRAYDLSTFPGTRARRARAEPPPERERRRARGCSRPSSPARSPPRRSSPARSCARRGEAQGIEIRDIASITKISPMHLRAIENEEADALPAPVYVRGFLQQIAKTLKLDPNQVTKTYLKRIRAMRPG